MYRRDERRLIRYALGMMKNHVSWAGKSLLTLAICACCRLLGGCNDTISDRNIEVVSLSQARATLQDKPGVARAIDTRPQAEFAGAHISGAINLELASVSESKDSIDPALARYKTLVVYGTDAGSGSARAMTKKLMRAGHKDVKLFAGGIAEWIGAGLKVDGNAPPKGPPQSTPMPK